MTELQNAVLEFLVAYNQGDVYHDEIADVHAALYMELSKVGVDVDAIIAERCPARPHPAKIAVTKLPNGGEMLTKL